MRHARTIFALLFLLLPHTVYTQDLKEELWAAARHGDAAAVKALLDKGVDVNSKFRYDATALSYASDKGHTEVVRLLLERGAAPNVKDTFYGATPLIWAAQKGHAEIVRLLLDKGAEGRDDALVIGTGSDYVEVVRVVLDKGGVKAEALSIALADALKNNRTEITGMLKKAGAVPPPKADFQVKLETLKSYEGVYKSPTGAELNVAVKDGKLTMTQRETFVLGAFDDVTFRPMEFEGATITFNLESGKVVSFTFKQGSNSTVFKKQ